ncbi:SusC/RagA family TonB-linked outer membrane protein [Pedobacter sp. SG918]|uniref:SusC/RagA family TonB-linked outer membrane protein n=1 Tax=Pedobacter sp. SG918 TaxID=2587136 RepID=UPI00146E32B0|nr:SusC/RagA family TonB-linked outer membrane protein [Pedobacter sp. SG918]NMN37122.1 TonB-linked SusC/RagA family outer membrane protein [Pedobacter sp. SG918]
MKLTIIIMTTLLMHVSASSFSQKLTYAAKNITVDRVFKEIEKQTNYRVLYATSTLNDAAKVNVNFKNTPLKEVIEYLLKDQQLTYNIEQNTVLIKKQERSFIEKIASVFTSSRFNGRIVDENNVPLVGATITVKGSKKYALSGSTGAFVLDLEENDVLVISYIGYETKELKITRGLLQSGVASLLDIKLSPSASSLDQVQVVGYGSTTKRNNTGAVSSITAEEIGKQTVENPLLALQGRIAGVQITQDNGLPGAAARMNIRGAFTGVSGAGYIPLYIIDGVPFTLFNGAQPATDNLNANGVSAANGGVSPFSIIAPEDIERIDILKDADATAIYGSRGSNGVVLITTKKGSKGKTAFNFNVNSGVSNVANYIPMMNTQEYLATRRAAFARSGVTPTTANALDLTVWDQNAYTDWQKYFIGHTGHTTNATGSVSGGNAQNSFLFSSTYRKQSTVFGGDFGATTFSSRLNAGHKSSDGRFNIDGSVNYTYMKNLLPSTDLSTIYNLAPNYPLYNANGSVNWTSTSPLSYSPKTTNAQTTNLFSNANLSYRIIDGLVVKANLGYTSTRLKQQQINPASSQNPATAQVSSLRYTDNDNNNYIIEPQAVYTTKIGEGNLEALIGTTFQQTKATGIFLTGTGFNNEKLINSLSSASSVVTSYSADAIYSYTAIFGRLNYNWQGKYIVDGTFRRDGSSRFGGNNKFGNFGAVGASWIFTQEDFMKNLSFLSFGKLRASYGITGNDQIPNYGYLSLYTSTGSSNVYDGVSTYVPSNIQNPDLKWETNKKLDIAVELGFLNDRILLKADYYRNRVSNLLNFITIPSQTGSTGYTANLNATVQTKGFEFELNTINVIAGDFKWNTNLNLTISRNKLLAFDNLENTFYASSYIIGQPTDIRKFYKYTGVNPATGLPTYQDLNGDGSISFAGDRYVGYYGHPYFAGMNNSLSYKGFALDFMFQYNHRYGILNSTLSSSPAGINYTNMSTALLDRWGAAGDTALFPAASTVNDPSYGNLTSSDVNWGDASYLKLKTVSLNYTFPKAMASKLKLSNLSVYVQGQNLYTWAKQKYTYDPETTLPGTGPGLGTGQYIAFPQVRTIVFGLNCSF